MTIAGLVIETIALRRAYDCTHDWQPYAEPNPPTVSTDPTEPAERCTQCGIIATAKGKKNLQAMSDSFHGRRPAS